MRNASSSILQCCIAYNEYGGYCVPITSYYRTAPQRILAGEVYEAKTIDFISHHCGEGDIIHGGTYFGDFLPALSKACAPKAKVWAFEPNPENYRCALITTYINSLQNVELINAALGNKEEYHSLLTSDASGIALGGKSRLQLNKGNSTASGRTEIVKVVTIDDTIPPDRDVSMIHLDVENYEQQALAGALETIRRCRPIIIVESLPEAKWLSDNILSIGYQLEGTIREEAIENKILMCE